MKLPGLLYSKGHRGQMFILATMLIAVYVVMMTAALMNLGANRMEFDRETLREPYLDSKREIQNFLELILAEHSKNETTIVSSSIAQNKIKEFLMDMREVYISRGVNLEVNFNTDNFNLIATHSPYANVSNVGVYTSEIYAEFRLKLSSVSSSFIIEEYFSVIFIGRVEIQGSSVLVQQSKGDQFEFIEAASVYIFNATDKITPSIRLDRTGIYNFEDLIDLNNIGILNVTLMNGVQIFS
ncbi:MAG: hypothetical protein ACFFB2_11350 [Promethearchaeota archaeon]